MLGFLGLFGLGAFFVSKTRETLDNAYLEGKARQRIINGDNPYGTYYDVHGREIDYLTGMECTWKRDNKTGDYILCDKYLRPYRNVTKEWLADRYDELKEAHPDWMTTSYFGLIRREYGMVNHCFWGDIWKDFETGAIYFTKSYKDITFYVDEKTGEFKRISDGQVLENKKIEKECEKTGDLPQSRFGYASEYKIKKAMEERRKFLKKYKEELKQQKNPYYDNQWRLSADEGVIPVDFKLAYDVQRKMGNVIAPREAM